MAGEVNATNVIIQNGTGAIVGQGSFTHTFGGTPIDISNKSNGDNVTLLDGELASKQHVFAGTIVYNDGDQFRAMRAAAFAGTQDTYTITYTSDATTDESFSGSFVPTGLSDDLPHGDKITTTISFNSSGVVTIVPASTP
jgi:predicted secreted protein